jgi:hypothetical protein
MLHIRSVTVAEDNHHGIQKQEDIDKKRLKVAVQMNL